MRKFLRRIVTFVVMVIIVNLFPCSYAANDGPVIYSPGQKQETVFREPVTIRWTVPSDPVNHYIINIRELSYRNTKPETGLMVVSNYQTTQNSFQFNPARPCAVHRISVQAKMADGTTRWSNEAYFFTTCHELNFQSLPVSFKIWSGFETETKNAIYYAAQHWKNQIGEELVNTYAFSNAYTTNTIVRDGVNAVVGVSVGTTEYLMTTVSRTTNDILTEHDINVNKSHLWANSAMANRYDVQSNITHEFGHVIGLSHKYESFAADWTMYGCGKVNSIAGRSLHSFDLKNYNDIATIING